MFAGLTGWHLVLILAIVLLLFGAPKLPGLARSIAQSMRIFRSEVKDPKAADGEADAAGVDAPSNSAADSAAAAPEQPAKGTTAKTDPPQPKK